MAELKPLKHKMVEDFLKENMGYIRSCTHPTHVIFPQIFTENLKNYQKVFRETGINGEVFFAYKANKSKGFIKAAIENGIGLEVSTEYELKWVLELGGNPSKIISSGPGKTDEFLRLSLTAGAIISMDSIGELERIIRVSHKRGLRAKVLIRINNIIGKSKFGFNYPLDKTTIGLLRGVELMGLATHINNYESDDRIRTLRVFLKLRKQLQEKGFDNCNMLDIGGGFTVNYTGKSQWKKLSKEKLEFWNNKRFSGSVYPYFSELAGANGLKHIIESVPELKEKGIKLFIEPGRSLLDQAGITVMQIADVKQQDDTRLVIANGNSFQLSALCFGMDCLVSPELISKSNEKNEKGYYIGGNLCLESDMLSWHEVKFRTVPQVGDLLVFYNTAGYQMDSGDSEFHQIPKPKKLSATYVNNKWKVIGDDS